ncbi:MAG TPA: tetratricopeptide repeat protein [Steroidobacteraceae bacterium]|nr:tetratricopeptide repeat protein [Steroidobacteraceae bacterium]
MAAEDYLTDEEQAEALKKWFGENWLWMVAGIVLALLALAGWQRYLAYKTDRSASAAQLLEQLAASQSDEAKTNSLLKQLKDDYAATPYTDQAQLLIAQQAVQAGKFDQAATALRSVMDSAHDEQLRLVARVRLARVLIQQQKADEALQLLDVSKAGAFAAQVHEVRGDALYSKGDRTGARAEYQSALDAAKDETGVDTSLLRLKADELSGDAPAPAVTAK